MPSTSRRSLLASLGTVTVAGLAGCSLGRNDRPPAGGLQFVNDHDLPHAVSMRVTGVGTEPGDGPSEVRGDPVVPQPQRQLSASTVVQPGETQTYETIFTEEVVYGVEFTLDGELPEDNAGQITFTPAPDDGERGYFLGGKVYQSGEFSWVVSSTGNPGPFDQ